LRIAKSFSLWQNWKHLFSSLTRHRIHNDVTSTRSWRLFLLISWIFSFLISWRIWFWIFLFRFFLTTRLILRSFWKMHEQSVYKNLHIFMKFWFRSVFNDDYFVCLHCYFIKTHSKIEKIHMNNMKAAFVKLEIKFKLSQTLQHQFDVLNVFFDEREEH
jgi:signal transduction histidine kinase